MDLFSGLCDEKLTCVLCLSVAGAATIKARLSSSVLSKCGKINAKINSGKHHVLSTAEVTVWRKKSENEFWKLNFWPKGLPIYFPSLFFWIKLFYLTVVPQFLSSRFMCKTCLVFQLEEKTIFSVSNSWLLFRMDWRALSSNSFDEHHVWPWGARFREIASRWENHCTKNQCIRFWVEIWSHVSSLCVFFLLNQWWTSEKLLSGAEQRTNTETWRRGRACTARENAMEPTELDLLWGVMRNVLTAGRYCIFPFSNSMISNSFQAQYLVRVYALYWLSTRRVPADTASAAGNHFHCGKPGKCTSF